MYYYIYETARSSNDRKIFESVKRIALNLGIAGEASTPSPARTIDELVEIGITKGYSTIVAVGGDVFANKVVSSLLNQKTEDQRIVFGYVPKVPTSGLSQQLGINTIDAACQALRHRFVKQISVGVVVPNKFFLTPLTLTSPKPYNLLVALPNLYAETVATSLSITPDINISWIDESVQEGLFQKISSIFSGKKTPNLSYTHLSSHILELKTEPSLPIHLGEEIIAKTPARIKTIPDYLHVVMNRDTLSPVRKDETRT